MVNEAFIPKPDPLLNVNASEKPKTLKEKLEEKENEKQKTKDKSNIEF